MQDAPGLDALSEEIYRGYGGPEGAGIEYFGQFKDALIPYGLVAVLLNQMRRYPLRYVQDFLLSLPVLWTETVADDWTSVMLAAQPRPEPTKPLEDSGMYADVHFLCKYVGVDAMNAYMGTDASLADKKNLLAYFRMNAVLLPLTDLDLEDLDGSYFVERIELRKLKMKLEEKGWLSFDIAETELVNHIDRLGAKLHPSGRV
jgi:hypothetical protein